MDTARSRLTWLVAITTFIIGGAYLIRLAPAEAPPSQPAAAATIPANTVPQAKPIATTPTKELQVAPTPATKKPAEKPVITSIDPPASTQSTSTEISRIENPYDTPPRSFAEINTAARAALVNIFCIPREGGSLRPISGSGVLIDSRGIILTNAHVAQYVLLSESPDIDLSCAIRIGAPAAAAWRARVIAFPSTWADTHVSELNSPTPAAGTGEHDWALLRISGAAAGATLPTTFPYLNPDTREGIGFIDDPVLGAGYPAEFVGGTVAQTGLYPVTSVTPINSLLTFHGDTVDMISIGSVIEAQGGSSGGPVVNAWNRLIGIITTTSAGTTTAERDLRALTLNYIDRDARIQLGQSLADLLTRDPIALDHDFITHQAPDLLTHYIAQIEK